jgi:hypothetical protein
MENMLLQDDLNALLGGPSENTIVVSTKEISGIEDLLSQDDLNALLGGMPENTRTVSQQMIISDMPVETKSGGESMTQEEIDEMLRQFDRDI